MSNLLSKENFANRIAKRTDNSNKEALKLVNTVIDEINLAVSEGLGLDFKGTLKLEVEQVEEQTKTYTDFTAKTPDGKYGKITKVVPAHKKLKMSCGKVLKEVANGREPKLSV
jgi:nucleoid DNA-binding protein